MKMKSIVKIAGALIIARLLYWPAKAVAARIYNELTPDINLDDAEDDGFVTMYPDLRG